MIGHLLPLRNMVLFHFYFYFLFTFYIYKVLQYYIILIKSNERPLEKLRLKKTKIYSYFLIPTPGIEPGPYRRCLQAQMAHESGMSWPLDYIGHYW